MFTLMFLDRINMMDRMTKDYRDVHADVFRQDEHDFRDVVGPQGCAYDVLIFLDRINRMGVITWTEWM